MEPDTKTDVELTSIEDITQSHAKQGLGNDEDVRLAAAQMQYERDLTIRQTIKIFWRSTLWICYGQLMVFNYGIDGTMAGSLLGIPRFRQDYGHAYIVEGQPAYVIPATWQSLYNGIAQLTAVLGAFMTGWMCDKIGRKYTNILSQVISVAGVAIQFWSSRSLGNLTLGKAINGISIGMWLIIAPLYASEVAPLKLRGWLTALTNVVLTCGSLFFSGFIYAIGSDNNKNAYLVPIAVQWALPGVILLTVLFWPESPVWLVQKGKIDQARTALRQLHVTVDEENRQVDDKATTTYLDCFRGVDRQRTLICMFLYSCQYLSGLTFVLGYQSYFYQLIGFTAKTAFLLTMLNTAVMVIANSLSWFVVEHTGRRPLAVWGDLQGNSSLYVYLELLFSMTIAPTMWSLVAELAPYRLRSRVQGLSNIMLVLWQWVIGFIFPYMFNPDAGNLGGKVSFVFGGVTFLAFIVLFIWLPETKGRTPTQLNRLYDMKVNPRHFAKTKVEDI
ncbi:maltose permease [Fusarium phyllophilum]|uniref:Maltose permease n=1 Tax=Fusarium phyllophilum TaxID=47803 RepID=A0A8H5NBF8_9HYPO|nr:maltose permease [Fusarium phyllophilum]